VELSIIIPFKNEEENIVELIQEIEVVMHSLGKKWELICIDDGSTDRTLPLLKELCTTRAEMRVLTFSKNFGQSSAFAAGFKAARGEFVITLDGDRQNDPADIPKLVDAIVDQDMVVGWRVNRKDTLQKRLISRFSNAVRSRVCRDGMHDTGCSLKVFRKSALDKIKLYDGMHRFLPALFIIERLRIKEIPVHHRKREKGKTKYHFFNRSLRPMIDLFVVNWMRKRALYYQIEEEITKR
jgi:dolichol-phosphate mannosyltransferase